MKMHPSLVFIAGCAAMAAAADHASASTETVIYSFPGGTYAYGHLDEIHPGLMYGTAYDADQHGTVFQLKESHGNWKAHTLHDFTGDDGANPYAGLIDDPRNGFFYGTTRFGGVGSGTVYSMTRGGTGWTENVLHDLVSSDGQYPDGMLMRDKSSGLLFGTATAGGNRGCGTVFSVNPFSKAWNVVYNFQGGADGCDPEAQLRPGSRAGTILGSTAFGGGSNSGTVFALTQYIQGSWTETVVHSFSGGADGSNPADIDIGKKNTLYGVAMNGGAHGVGAVFQIKGAFQRPKFKVIYSFTGGSDGREPVGIHLDSSTGILYGTTQNGGASGLGTVFKLSFNGISWVETVLHSFEGGSDGATPSARPVLESVTGNLYGTTLSGGAHNGGVVYQITP